MATHKCRAFCESICASNGDGEKLLEDAITRSLRPCTHDHILKVARTIADLDASAAIEPKHLGRSDLVPYAGPLLLGLTHLKLGGTNVLWRSYGR